MDTSWSSIPASPKSVSYTANALNQYTAVGAVTPTYDGNGNLTFDGTFTYRNDVKARLTAMLSAAPVRLRPQQWQAMRTMHKAGVGRKSNWLDNSKDLWRFRWRARPTWSRDVGLA